MIELLIVIAILGILAAAVLVAVNPGKRMAQASDAQRKNDISQIANALVIYQVMMGVYPDETNCDTSKGAQGTSCNPPPWGNNWDPNTPASPKVSIYQGLIANQGILKHLPKDPLNNPTYYYRYEPAGATGATPYTCDNTGTNPCTKYWIGVLLEAPADPLNPYFRCSDDENLDAGGGCKEVKNPGSGQQPNVAIF